MRQEYDYNIYYYLPPLVVDVDVVVVVVGVFDITSGGGLVGTTKVEYEEVGSGGGEDVGITIISNIIITLLSIVHTTYISQLLQLVHIPVYY